MKGVWKESDLLNRAFCPGCHQAVRSIPVTTRMDGLSLKQCKVCSLAYLDPYPSPEALSQYYCSEYFTGDKDFFAGKNYCEERDAAIESKNVTGYREIVKYINVQGKSVLDIGCATGALLESLKQKGAQRVTGIDIAEYPISFGRKRYSLDLQNTSLESANFRDNEFDLICMIDVIEHVPDLNSFLREAIRCLKAGGNIFIITPNFKAFEIVGEKWYALQKDFEHLHYLSPESINSLAINHRYSVKQIWTSGLPVPLGQYDSTGSHSQFNNIMRHPIVALRNVYSRIRYRRIDSTLHGGQLFAVLEK